MFDWNASYDIGNARVDSEHQELFRQLGMIGRSVEAGIEDEAALEGAVNDLIAYAKSHFEDEEAVMVEAGVDKRHVMRQRMEHHSFMYDIEKVRRVGVGDDTAERYERLLSFAMNWLVFHTLQTDQLLGVQLKAIAAGKTPADAYDEAQHVTFGPTINRPVVDALVHLWTGAMETIGVLEERLKQASGESAGE